MGNVVDSPDTSETTATATRTRAPTATLRRTPTPQPTPTPSPTPTPIPRKWTCPTGTAYDEASNSCVRVLPQRFTRDYVVQPGDTLRSIAEQFGTTIDALVEANDIEDPDVIRTGSTLRVSMVTRAVAEGDATPTPSATPTPIPTPTPGRTPTATTTSCPTPAEEAYIHALVVELADYGPAVSNLGNLLLDAANDPLVLVTDEFRIAFVIQAATVAVASDNILDLTPPNSRQAQRIHRLASAMARKAIASMEAFTEAIDNLDGNKLEEGGRLIEEAAGYLADMQRIVERFCE